MSPVWKKCGLWPALLCGFAGCAASALAASPAGAAGEAAPPPVLREFRGLWAATVNNIDWPSKPGLDSAAQKRELLALLDRAAALRFNALILQVRPACDALYPSPLEPWSEYLTGRMGRAPSPFYDPLAFAVAEAHKRGLELHAWFNPYRARFRDLKTPAAANHVSLLHPEWVRAYGQFLWLDPGEAGTREYSRSVVMDVVRRYDIDGVHLDDYFYPYPESAGGREMDFPDDAPWRRYQEQGGKLSRADWRRENVNQFVRALYESIKKEKPWVKFGVSPFGIWRPSNPPPITGFDAYDKLYCDARKWLAEGWLDYCAPQLYWPADDKAHSFPVLLQWWAAQNTRHRHLWPGMMVNGWKEVSDPARELALEIDLTRRQAGALGEILWHAGALLRPGNGAEEILRARVYPAPALPPASPWLAADPPARPFMRAALTRDKLKLSWQSAGGPVWLWVLQKKAGGHWTTEILPGAAAGQTIRAGPAAPLPGDIALFAVDRCDNLSAPTLFHAAR
jgi:uncharacterized lipoprotein YddW (UPF0748 family)